MAEPLNDDLTLCRCRYRCSSADRISSSSLTPETLKNSKSECNEPVTKYSNILHLPSYKSVRPQMTGNQGVRAGGIGADLWSKVPFLTLATLK